MKIFFSKVIMFFYNNLIIKFFSISFIIISIFFLFSVSNLVSFLLFLELNGFLLVLLLFIKSRYETSEFIFLYFILNTLVFILFLWGVSFCKELLVILSLFLKIGFFPFLWWFPYLVDNCSFFSFFLIGILQKGIPLFVIFWNNLLDYQLFVILSILTVSISLVNLVYNQNKIKVFLAWSSSINFSWILLVFIQWWSFGFSYYFFYCIVICFFLYAIRREGVFWDQVCFSNSRILVVSLVTFCSFSGFPPFIGFYYKYIFFRFWNFDYDFLGISLVYGLLLALIFALNSFIYINMMFKLKIKKWTFQYNIFSRFFIYLFIIYIFFSFYSFFV